MTLDEKLEWTFRTELTYYTTRVGSRNSTRAEEVIEVFFDNPDTRVMQRSVEHTNYTVRCTSWKQALLYTFYSASYRLKIEVKEKSYIFGKGYIIDMDGKVLLDCNRCIIDREFLMHSDSKSLEETFVKYVLPIIVTKKQEITIKDSSSFKKLAVKPKTIGKKLNEDLIQCAKNSLTLLEL